MPGFDQSRFDDPFDLRKRDSPCHPFSVPAAAAIGLVIVASYPVTSQQQRTGCIYDDTQPATGFRNGQ